jgi:hypothetical protein
LIAKCQVVTYRAELCEFALQIGGNSEQVPPRACCSRCAYNWMRIYQNCNKFGAKPIANASCRSPFIGSAYIVAAVIVGQRRRGQREADRLCLGQRLGFGGLIGRQFGRRAGDALLHSHAGTLGYRLRYRRGLSTSWIRDPDSRRLPELLARGDRMRILYWIPFRCVWPNHRFSRKWGISLKSSFYRRRQYRSRPRNQ